MQGREKAQLQLFGTRPLSEILPEDHPLRKIRSDFDAVYSRLADAFETNYGTTGNPSVPTAVLLRAFLLRALYSIKSERALCEQIEMNVGFRWFVGLDWDDKVFDHSTLSTNRARIFGSGAAEALLGEVVRLAESRRLLASDRMVVDGTLVKAWASHKSFKAKDGSDNDKPNFKGGKRSNKTHASTSDPDARLLRKGPGKESVLCHLGHVLVDSVSGLVRGCRVTRACGLEGEAEVVTAIELAEEHMSKGQALVADRGYDTKAFVNGIRALGDQSPSPRQEDGLASGWTNDTQEELRRGHLQALHRRTGLRLDQRTGKDTPNQAQGNREGWVGVPSVLRCLQLKKNGSGIGPRTPRGATCRS
jgi:transposase